jgi:hypothetical protein
LKELTLKGNFHLSTISNVCGASPNLHDLKACCNGDLCGFEPNMNREIREDAVISKLEGLLGAAPNLRTFQGSFSHRHSNLEFLRCPQDEERDFCNQKLESARRIKEHVPTWNVSDIVLLAETRPGLKSISELPSLYVRAFLRWTATKVFFSHSCSSPCYEDKLIGVKRRRCD